MLHCCASVGLLVGVNQAEGGYTLQVAVFHYTLLAILGFDIEAGCCLWMTAAHTCDQATPFSVPGVWMWEVR